MCNGISEACYGCYYCFDNSRMGLASNDDDKDIDSKSNVNMFGLVSFHLFMLFLTSKILPDYGRVLNVG